MKVVCCILFVLLLGNIICQESQVQTWGYSENGHDWASTCRSGSRQSPINILKEDVRNCRIINPEVSLSFLNTQVKTVLKLEDQTLRDSLSEKVAFLTAPDLNGVVQSYALSNIHFHTYSEHQIDSVNSKLEMHMVFKTDSPKTNDSVAVVGVRFEVATTAAQNKSTEVNLVHVLNPDNYESEMELNLHELFDGVINKPGQRFFHYKGSLTTPPCSEVVNWYVIEQPLYMKGEDYKPFFDKFFQEEFSHKHGNFRFTQPLNGRNPCFVKIPEGNIVNLHQFSHNLKSGLLLAIALLFISILV